MPLLAEYATHPRTYGFQSAQPLRRVYGWLPDLLMDTTGGRKRKARKLLGEGEGVLPRMWTLPGHTLFHVVLPLPRDLDFYTQAPAAGRAEMALVFPKAPTLAQVAYGRAGHLHVHALVALPAGTNPPPAATFGRVHAVRVETASHLEKLAQYFSRPADERAARPNLEATQRYSRRELREQRLDASEMYLEARSRAGRLPQRRWRRNIPRDLWNTAGQVALVPHGDAAQPRRLPPASRRLARSSLRNLVSPSRRTLAVRPLPLPHNSTTARARSPPTAGEERALTMA